MNLNKETWLEYSFGDVAIQQKESVERENTNLDKYIAGEHISTEDLHIRKWGVIGENYLGPAFHRKFCKGDILYGSRRTYLKKVAVAHFDGITANTTFVIKANSKIIEPRILPFLMLSDSFTEHSVKNSKGSVNPYINWKDIANYKFKLPPLPEQKRLADLLWSVDEVVESYRKLTCALKEEFRVILEGLIKQPTSSSVQLGDFVKIEKGLTYGSNDYGDETSGNILINLKCFEKFGGFNKEGIKFYNGEYSDKHILYKHDLIIANTDITRNGDVVGFPVLVPDFGERIVLFTMDVSKLIIKNKSMLGTYLFYLLRTQWAHWYMYAHSHGTTVLHLDLSSVPKLPILKVSLNEQERIVKKLQAIENSIQKYRDLTFIIEQCQKQLINQIFG